MYDGDGKQSFFAGMGSGFGGGAIGLFNFVCPDFSGRTEGGSMDSSFASILRMFAVLDSGPGRTEGGNLTVLVGTVTAVGFVTAGCSSDSLSRSSSEKSRSWVERGGKDSTHGDDRVVGLEKEVFCFGSADNSRAICVPLSRKSSQLSIDDGHISGVGFGVGIG